MTDHRDTARFDDDGPAEPRSWSSRRFARLADHPAARRLALPRLAWAVAGSVALVGLLALGGSRAVRTAAGFLRDHPSQQIPIEEVRLVPAPDPWIGSGSARFLRAVGDGDRVQLLDLDLEAVAKALRLCPWVKDVGQIRREHGALTIPLTYYQPAAMAFVADGGRIVVDRDGIILPAEDIAWETSDPKSRRLRGRSDALIQLEDFDPPAEPRAGSYWGRDGRADRLVVRAARLADFLAGSARRDGSGRLRFDLIRPDKAEPPLGLFARTADDVWVFWDWSPEVESPDRPPAVERWSRLRDRFQDQGRVRVKAPNYLCFEPALGLAEYDANLKRPMALRP